MRDQGKAGDFSVETRLCLVGGAGGRPELLPTEVVDARECVALCAFEPWLNRVLCGHSRGECADVVGHFVSEVYAALGSEGVPEEDESGEGGAVADGGAQAAHGASCGGAIVGAHAAHGASCGGANVGAGGGKGRAALGLDSDSDCEQLAAGGDAPRRAPAGTSARVPTSWKTIRLRGEELTVRRRRRGRGVLLPVAGSDLPRALAMLRAALSVEATPAAPPKKRQRVERAAVELLPVDAGRVVWVPTATSWEVVYLDDGGVKRRTKKQLRAPSVDAFGRPLAPEQVADDRRALLLAARRRWNELDRSKLPRYAQELVELPETS